MRFPKTEIRVRKTGGNEDKMKRFGPDRQSLVIDTQLKMDMLAPPQDPENQKAKKEHIHRPGKMINAKKAPKCDQTINIRPYALSSLPS